MVTHLGQVLVFDAHRGDVIGTPLDLVDGRRPDRFAARARRLRAAHGRAARSRRRPPSRPATGMVVIALWQPDAPAPMLVGLQYHPGQTPLLTREWTSDAVGGGSLASPVLSADGTTVYVNGRDQQLWALNTADGKPKWSVPLDFLPQTPPSVSPDGLIVAGGGPDSQAGRHQGRRRPRPT